MISLIRAFNGNVSYCLRVQSLRTIGDGLDVAPSLMFTFVFLYNEYKIQP